MVGPRGMRIEMQIAPRPWTGWPRKGVAAWRYKDKSYGFDLEHQQAAGGRDPLVTCATLSRCWSMAATPKNW